MKLNQLKLGSILSYLQMGLSIAISLVYTPIMLGLLGKSEYGLYSTISSTVATMSILNLGFSASYIRYYAKYKQQNDQEKIYALNGLFLTIFSVIGGICLILGLLLSGNLNLIFSEGLTAGEYSTARSLTILMTLSLSALFVSSTFSSIITAHERFVFLKLVTILKSVLSHAVILLFLLAGYRSVTMACITLIFSVVSDLLSFFYVVFILKQKFTFKLPEPGIMGSLFGFTSFIALNLIVDQINWNIDKLVLARFVGTAEVAIYSIGFQLYNYYMTFSTAISGVFTPRVHNITNTYKDSPVILRQKLTELFLKVGRVQVLILSLIASGLVFFGYSFITQLWAGSEYGTSYTVMLLLVLPASIALVQNLGIEIQRALNMHRFRSIIYTIMALLNLAISVILCPLYGAAGCAFGTALSLIVANGFIMNIYYHKKCSIDILQFWNSVLRLLLGLVPAFAFGAVFTHFFSTNSWSRFILGVVIYSTVYALCAWLFSMNQYEKSLITSIFKKKGRVS